MEILDSCLQSEEEDWIETVNFLLDTIQPMLNHLDLNLLGDINRTAIRLVLRGIVIKSSRCNPLIDTLHKILSLVDSHGHRLEALLKVSILTLFAVRQLLCVHLLIHVGESLL